MVTTNPTSYIVVVAEHAAAKILALGASTGGSSSSIKPSSAAPTKASSTPVPPKSSSATPPKSSTKATTPTPTKAPAQPWSQCGGDGYTGPTACTSGWKCAFNNQWFSQCVPN